MEETLTQGDGYFQLENQDRSTSIAFTHAFPSFPSVCFGIL